MLEEIEFHRLAKLRLEVDDPVDLWVYNFTLAASLTYSFEAIRTGDFSHTTNHMIV
jgi:hypothetical protein